MRQYWRLQQSQTLISMAFWVTTLTLLIWPYVSWRFRGENTFLGISTTYYGLASIGALVVFFVFLIGFIYDRFLGLWKEQRTVDTERNPFGTYALIPANVFVIGHLNEILRRQAADDVRIQDTCAWVDSWLQWCGEQEIWVRSQKFWDENLPSPVPDLHFFPSGLVDASRDRADSIAEDGS